MTAQAHTLYSSAWIYASTEITVPEVATPLDVPSVEQPLAYGLRCWGGAAARLLCGHELHPRRAGRYAAAFEMSAALRQRWSALFDTGRAPRAHTDYPFLHAQGTGTLLYRRIFADLGVRMRHVVHLRHLVSHPASAAAFAAADKQTVDCHLLRAVRVGHNEVLVILAARISDAAGRLLALVEDSFLVRGLQVPQAAQAEDDDQERRALARLARRRTEIDSRDPRAQSRLLYLSPDLGRRFAGVAGHFGRLDAPRVAALLGDPRPVASTMVLRNLIVRELAEHSQPIERLAITFVSEARLGQSLRLTLQDRRFELCTEGGRLVAFGKA